MPIGRILLKSISESRKLAELETDGARLLFTWLIPHCDINGCFSGDLDIIKGQVFTRLKKTDEEIGAYLSDLQSVGLIARYESNGDQFIFLPSFEEKQPYLNPKKEAKPKIPRPTPEQVQTNSGPGPDKPALKVKENLKVKDKEKIRDATTRNPGSRPPGISYAEGIWTGITDEDRAGWGKAYPACDLNIEFAKMTEWLKANPTKGKKSNWRRFINNWLSRNQDRGGSQKSGAGGFPFRGRPDQKTIGAIWLAQEEAKEAAEKAKRYAVSKIAEKEGRPF